MIDRLFTAALTFCLLAGGTLAIGSALFEGRGPAAPQVVQLPAVEITGKRLDAGLAWAQPQAAERASRNVQ